MMLAFLYEESRVGMRKEKGQKEFWVCFKGTTITR
jgi:hypothetical protein